MAAILADNNFKCIFLNENDRILFRISLKFVPRSPIDNKPALVQVVAWRRTGGGGGGASYMTGNAGRFAQCISYNIPLGRCYLDQNEK